MYDDGHHHHDRDPGEKVDWYRIPIGGKNLSALNQKSDLKGFVQTLGFMAILAGTGSAAYFSIGRLPWYCVIPLFLLHGSLWPFWVNGFHELIHDSVFKTRWLNGFFLRIFSFFGWLNHVQFWASHTEHHKFTLHPPDDLEETLPKRYNWWRTLRYSVVNPWWPYNTLRGQIRTAFGVIEGDWMHHLFDDEPELRRKLKNWARVMLIGHGVIIAVSIYFGWWALPLVTTLAPMYGSPLHFFTNSAQHAGLRDNVPDFRLCCRTIYLNPVLQFIYWNMNFHTEHHMYAGVPCYNLPKLHALMKADMPYIPSGLWETWKGIVAIEQRQKYDPSYLFTPEVPPQRSAKAMKATKAVDPTEPISGLEGPTLAAAGAN